MLLQDIIKQDAQRLQEGISELSNELDLRVEVTPAQYRFITSQMALAENPQEMEVDIASALTYSRNLGLPLDFCLNNLDALTQVQTGLKYTPTATSFKAIANSFKVGDLGNQRGDLGDQYREVYMSGGDVTSIQAQIQDIDSQIENLQDHVPRNWITEALKMTAQTMPYTGQIIWEGVKGAAVGAGIAGIASLIPGVGPAMAAAGATAKVISAVSMLFRAKETLDIVGGNQFYDMVQDGVDARVAYGMSYLSGALSAGIEAGLGGLTGSAMSALGISPQKFASRVATRMYLSGTMGTLANTATQHLLTAGSEGLEEFTETLKDRLMEHIAYELSDMDAPVQDKSALSQALDDFSAGFVSSLFLGIPFTAMQGYSDYRTASSIRGDSQTILSKKAFMDKYGSKKPQGVSEEDWTRTMEGMWNEGKEARMATINERLKTQAVDIEAEPRFDEEGNLVDGGQRTYPIERTAAGNLYMQEAEPQRLPGNVSEHTLKIGSPKTGKAYGYITYRIDEDGNKLEIVSMKTYDAFTSIRKEAMQDLLRRYPDMDITWDPDADVDIALREQLMRENPQGYERGLNYGTAQDVEDKTYIMNRLGNLFSDDNAVNSGLATLVQMTARTEGMTGRAWWGRYIKDLRKMDQPGARGRIDFVEATEGMQAVIYAGEHADATTFEHELVHLIMSIGDRKAQFKAIFDKVKDTDQFKEFVDDTRMVRTSSEALSNLFQSDEWTVADEEFVTELYEAWRTTGQTHNAELRSFFQRISEVFRRVYQAIRPYAKLNDEVVDFFESFYAAMPGAQESEATATSTAQDVEVDTASTVAESVISEEGEAEEAVPEEAQPTASAGPEVDEDGIPYRRGAPRIRQKSYPKTVKRGRPKRLRQSLVDEDMDARYMAAVESGDIETVRRMVQERAEAMGFEDAIPEQTEAYVLRTKPAPKKTIKVYKTFTVDAQGNPTALFVAGTAKLPRGVWLDAVDTYHFTASNGRQYIPSTQNPNTAGGKTGASVEIPSEEVRQELVDRGYLSEDSKAKKITALAYRPGWHAGDEPFFPQGGIQDTGYVADEEAYAQLAKDIREQEGVSDARAKELRLERYGTFDEWRGQERTQAHPYKNLHRRNQVVFECEMSADNDYTRTTTIRSGANKGKVQYADMQEMPTDGSYRYATNPMTKASDKGVWYISGTLKIVRPLTQQEADSILVNDGFMPQGWEGGTMDLEALNVPMEQDDAARKTLAPITYDEQGNVIPLSERFNAQSANVLYQTDTEYGGYDWTRGMSNRAVMAYEAGERPLSRWTKDLMKSEVEKMAGRDVARILMELPLKDLKDALLYNSSYHHTGRYFNRTDFYSINEDVASLTEEQARQFVDDYKAYTKALDDYSKAYAENARRIREAATTGGELDLTYHSATQDREYTDRVRVTGPITGRYGVQQYHFTNISEFEDERRRMMPAYEALDPAIQGFINDNFNEDDVSAGGNIYERGRKPSRSDYDNPDYFKEGERRIATSGNTLELQEYRDGAWSTVVASTLPEGYSFRDIYLLARNTTPDSIIDFSSMRAAPFTSGQLTRPTRPSLPRSLFQMDREYDPRHAIPKVRGGWTKDKILRYLKAHPSMSGPEQAIRLIREFDSPEELKEHMFYHGTPYGTSKGLVPSMTFSERKAEEIGGGGYGERYWAISVTKDKKIASQFSAAHGQVSIYPIILAKNAVVKQMDIEDSADLDEHIVDLYTEGVDAVWVGDHNSGEQELAVINPLAIVNIGTPDIYKVFQLGSPRNPISIADDAQVERIYDYAKQHPSLRERDYGAPKIPLPSDFTSEEEYEAARKKYRADKEEWYKTQGYMDYLSAKNERRRAILFQTAYHGSPHDFEAFSTDFMGTGEGAQMFGWGIYLSDLEEVGEHYSNMAYTVKARSEEVQRYERMINAENRLLERFNMEYETSLTGERFKGDPEYEALASGRYDDIVSPTMRERFRTMPPEEAASIYRRERAEASQRNIKATEVRLENLRSALEDARNRQTQTRNLYTVEIPDDAKWLDWMKKAPRGIFKQLTRDPDFRDVLIYSYGSLEDAKPDFTGKTGAGIYGTIATLIGNDRNASELLSRIGYTGIRYPVDATSATPSATDSNYVIFNDADIRIIRHARSLYQSDSGNTSILDAEGEPVLTHAAGDGTILIGGRGLAMSFLEADGPAANVNPDTALEGAQGVGLSDFTAAVIPDDLPGDQLDRLNEAGLQITSYPASNPGMREVVLQEAIKATARPALFQDTYYNGWLYEVESYAREASSFTELEAYVNAMVNPFFDTPPDQDSILRDVWNSVRRGSDADYGTDISEDYYGEGGEDFDTEDYLSHAGRYSGSFTRAAKEYSIESPDQSISTQGDKDAYFVDLLDNPSQRNFLSFMKSLKDILDGVKEWNRIYGRDETGFTAEDQAQFEDLLEKSSMIENSLPLYFRNFLKSKVLEEMLDRQSKGQDPVPTDEARNSVARVMGYIRRSPRAYRGLYATISGNAYWEAVFDYAPFIEENLPADFGQLSFSERNAVVQALDNQRVKEAIRSGKEPYTNGEVERLLDEYDERIRQAQEEAADLQSQLEESQDAQSKVTSVLKGLSKQDEERKKSVIRLDRELDKASREVAQKAREVGIKDQATTAGFNTPGYRDSLRYYDSELSKLFPDPMETIRKKIKRLQDQEVEYTRTATAQRKEAQADRRVLETRWKDINRLRATVERKDSEIRAIKYRMDQKMEELKAKIDKVANEADRKLFETQLRDAQRLRDTVARNERERNDLKFTYGQKMKQIRGFLEKRFDDKELTIRLGYEKRIGEMRKRHEKAIADLKQLYKERAALRKAKEYKRKLARIIMRRISANVNMEEADAIREVQAYLDPAFRSRMRIGGKESMDISTLKKLYREDPGNIIFSSLSPEKLARLAKADLNELTISELEDLAAMVNYLYRLGLEKRRAYLEARRAEVRQYQSAFINEVMSSKRYTGDNPLPGTKQQRNLDRSFRFKLASLYDSTINMDRLAQKLDGGRKGLFFDLLVRRKREHEAEQWRNTSERTKRIYDFIKEEKVDLNSLYRTVDISLPAVSSNGLDFDARMVTLTVSDLAYFYLSPGNERNVAALSYGSLVTKAEKEEVRQTFKDREDASDILNSTIRELGDQRYAQVYEVARSVIEGDPKVLALVRMIEEDFNEPGHFDRIRDLMLRVYNTDVEREDYYLPISRSEVMGEPAEKLREDVLNVIPGTKATVEQGFTKSRQDISPYNQTIASFDLFKVWQDSIYNEEHTAANLEYVRLLNGVFINRGSEALREYITQTYGSHVMEMVDTHIKQVANPKAFTDNLASNRLIRALRGNLYSAYLGFKLSTVVMQLVSSPMPFLGAVNPLELLSSYLKVMAHPNEMWDTITTLSPFMANRSFDMVPEMLRQALSQADLQKIRKKMLQIQQFGMSGLEAVDRFTVAGGWYAIYQKELAKMDGGDLAENMRKAAQVADEYVQETQPQGNITELAPLFKDKGEAVKLITAFQSALNVIWQNVTFDIPQAFKNREYGKAAGMVTGYIIAGALIYLIQEGFDDDDDDKDKMRKILYSFTTQFSAGVPLVGDMVDNLLYHFITGDKAQSFGDTFFPSADKFFKGMDKVADGDWRKAVQYILEAVSLSLGLPYSGVKELQAIEEEGIGAIFGRRG